MRRSALVALLAAALWAAPAFADAQADFDRARNAYLAKQYDEADSRFSQLLDPSRSTVKDTALVTQARMYWGATKVALKQETEARRIFEQLITADRDFDPDPLRFPTAVLNEFSDARRS